MCQPKLCCHPSGCHPRQLRLQRLHQQDCEQLACRRHLVCVAEKREGKNVEGMGYCTYCIELPGAYRIWPPPPPPSNDDYKTTGKQVEVRGSHLLALLSCFPPRGLCQVPDNVVRRVSRHQRKCKSISTCIPVACAPQPRRSVPSSWRTRQARPEASQKGARWCRQALLPMGRVNFPVRPSSSRRGSPPA